LIFELSIPIKLQSPNDESINNDYYVYVENESNKGLVMNYLTSK